MASTTSKLKPFIIYISPDDHKKLGKLSKASRKSMTQLVREGLSVTMSSQNPYASGFNDGLNKAISVVEDLQVSKMRFPSGLSFAELVRAEVEQHTMTEVSDEQPADVK